METEGTFFMVTRAHKWTFHEPDESLIGKGAGL